MFVLVRDLGKVGWEGLARKENKSKRYKATKSIGPPAVAQGKG